MAKLRSIYLACACVVGQAGLASAADLGPYQPPVVEVPAPMPVPVFSNWYMRGYVGMTNQQVDELDSPNFNNGDFDHIDQDFESSPLWGLGIGYDTGRSIRFDVTGEYRGAATFHGLDRYDQDDDGDFDGTNDYTAIKKDWLFLANAYWDIGTWHSVTPYVGAGIGWSSITIDNFKDVNEVTGGVAFADSNTESNFAWALHAGLAYDVTPNFTIDLGYRYVDLGDAKTGTVTAYDGSSSSGGTEFHDITSHDLLLGVRWKFGDMGSPPCCSYSPMK